jgi:CheY-like chemotaxis protein
MAVELKFKDKSARVILVDSSGSVRQLLSEVMKSLGFANAQAVASIADAHSILEAESADWLIVPLNADQELHGLHTVRMMINFAELKNVRVSLLLEEKESWVLSKAFEYGLLSYHSKPFTKDSLRTGFEELMRLMEGNDWDSTRTSAEYLRRHLAAANQTADLLALEKNLQNIYPGNSKLLINLASALHLSGSTDSAKATLRQVEFIDPSLAATVKETRKALFGSTATDESAAAAVPGENILGLGALVIIDNDDAVRSSIKAIFTELGCPQIQDFADGEAALDWMKGNPEPSLVVSEWRIPKVTGPLLLQRIRALGFTNVPILILSALIKPMDMPIIREMGVANLAEKPMDRAAFLKSVIWTIQQDRMPTESQTMENKIRALLSAKKMQEAEEIMLRYLDDATINAGRKAVIRAEHAFAKDSYELARDFAIEAIKQSGESLFALNILGKSLMILRQFEQALKCFQKAQGVSPMNLERLVMIAETQAEIGDAVSAGATINKSKDIDPDSKTVQDGEVKVALATGSSDAAKDILGKMESMSNIIGYLNNKAIAHAKCGFGKEGIEIYEKTIQSIPPDKRDILAIVNYNMALAKIRNGDLAGAMPDLDAVIAIPESRVHKKAANLKERLSPALTTGMTFSLREADQVQAPTPESSSPESAAVDAPKIADATTLIKAMLEMAPGDQCCYLVFQSTAPIDADLTKALSTPPKFKLRKTIERGETFTGSTGAKSAS